MPPRKAPVIRDAIIDELLAKSDSKAIFDSNGLEDDLKKAFAERVQNAELDHHLDDDDEVDNSATATLGA